MGQFSWFAQDTKNQIFNDYDHQKIHMVDPRDGTDYLEEHYEGYGIFGGRDFYELFADLNKYFIFKYVVDSDIKKQSFDYYRLNFLNKIYRNYKNLSYDNFQKDFLTNHSSDIQLEDFDVLITKLAKEEYEKEIKKIDNIEKIFSKNWKDLTENELDDKRSFGINLWFTYIECDINSRIPHNDIILSPILVENYNSWQYYTHSYPQTDPDQGWHYFDDHEEEY